MPVTPTYPGVYIQELPSPVRTIMGVSTSITAFVGRAEKGPVDVPVRIFSMAEYVRTFGDVWKPSPLSYAVSHYFLNGGSDAIVVRVAKGAAHGFVELPAGTGTDTLTIEAKDPGAWGNNLRIRVAHPRDATDKDSFSLVVEETWVDPVTKEVKVVRAESFIGLTLTKGHPLYAIDVLRQDSRLVRVWREDEDDPKLPAVRPNATAAGAWTAAKAGAGKDGDPIGADQVSADGLQATKKGMYALEGADLFNLLCIPPFDRDTDVADTTHEAAAAYARRRRAVYLFDAPRTWTSVATATSKAGDLIDPTEDAAVYFPRVRMVDPKDDDRLNAFAASPLVAGVLARTDAQRGVWKAPAGLEATLRGVKALTVNMTDPENGLLNPLGINCLRTFPVAGTVVWGARTLRGADELADQWKYLAVRRTALFIEESLYRGTKWVVFEPNDEPLWAQIRLNVGTFMHNLFRQGAFQGSSPREAYFVQCDRTTTTQADIDRGIVNVLVGFAPLKPAEFVVIQISQITRLETP